MYIRGGKWSFKNQWSRKIFAKFHGSHNLIFQRLCASRSLDFSHKAVSQSQFFSRLRKSLSTDLLFFVVFIKLNDITTSQNLDVFSLHLKHFEVSVSQLKKSKCLGLAKKIANLVVSQSLAFTICHPLHSAMYYLKGQFINSLLHHNRIDCPYVMTRMLPILNPVEDVEDGQAYFECKTVV